MVLTTQYQPSVTDTQKKKKKNTEEKKEVHEDFSEMKI